METFAGFNIKILHHKFGNGWYYEIYDKDGLLESSNELYPSEGIARYAAIGQIYLMEINNSQH